MASVPNRAYPFRESSQVGPITNVIATNVTGSTYVSGSTIQGSLAQIRASSPSGSAIVHKGYVTVEGFVTSGSVLTGSVLVIDATNDNCVSGSTSDLPTGIIGVAERAVAAGGSVSVIVYGITPKILIASGSITAGNTVGSAGLSGSNCIAANTTAGKILGVAIADIATAQTGSIFISPR